MHMVGHIDLSGSHHHDHNTDGCKWLVTNIQPTFSVSIMTSSVGRKTVSGWSD